MQKPFQVNTSCLDIVACDQAMSECWKNKDGKFKSLTRGEVAAGYIKWLLCGFALFGVLTFNPDTPVIFVIARAGSSTHHSPGSRGRVCDSMALKLFSQCAATRAPCCTRLLRNPTTSAPLRVYHPQGAILVTEACARRIF